jgi:hypothetical protein
LISKSFRAGKVFSFDSSWDDYYLKYYAYNREDLIYIGNPDFLLLKETKSKEQEDAICYISQSLVEDGRYTLKNFEKFLLILKEAIPHQKKLYVKLHPRTILTNYNVLRDNENIEFVNNFPNCLYYIGHYSSLIALAKQCSDNILIWNLKNHHMPQYFCQFASVVTGEEIEMKKFMNGGYQNKTVEKQFRGLTKEEINDFDPINKIVTGLIENKM